VRGFRFIGKIEHVSQRDYHESDLLFFSPSEDGSDMRRGCVRARDFDLFSCQTAVVTGVCESDYVFVATALGETAFDRVDA
jgi:hypothetical protein